MPRSKSSISTEPRPEATFSDIVQVSDTVIAYPQAVRRRRAAGASRRRPAPAHGPVEVRNHLDELPEALRRLVLRTGDTRTVRQFRTASGGHGVEMDIDTARRLDLVK